MGLHTGGLLRYSAAPHGRRGPFAASPPFKNSQGSMLSARRTRRFLPGLPPVRVSAVWLWCLGVFWALSSGVALAAEPLPAELEGVEIREKLG